MKNDSIIFDLDGTLWNACSTSAEGWNEGLKSLGITAKKVTTEDIARVVGKPYDQCIEILFPELVKEYKNLKEVLNLYEEKAVKGKGGIIYDGVAEGMEKLSKFYKLFIVSNCSEWYLELFFKFCDIKRYIKDATCYGKAQLSKDEMIVKIKNDYGLKNPVYIGDIAGDQKAANSAGVDFVHVAYGFGEPEMPCLSLPFFNDLVRHFIKQN